jgi:hypothetical protein
MGIGWQKLVGSEPRSNLRTILAAWLELARSAQADELKKGRSGKMSGICASGAAARKQRW